MLLKPTHPAMSLDSTFTQRAFGEGGPDGQLWAGYTAYDENSLVNQHHVLWQHFLCQCLLVDMVFYLRR